MTKATGNPSALIAGDSCPSCGVKKTKVLETRRTSQVTRRRRCCDFCATKFSTIEIKLPEITRVPGAGYAHLIEEITALVEEYDVQEGYDRVRERAAARNKEGYVSA